MTLFGLFFDVVLYFHSPIRRHGVVINYAHEPIYFYLIGHDSGAEDLCGHLKNTLLVKMRRDKIVTGGQEKSVHFLKRRVHLANHKQQKRSNQVYNRVVKALWYDQTCQRKMAQFV